MGGVGGERLGCRVLDPLVHRGDRRGAGPGQAAVVEQGLQVAQHLGRPIRLSEHLADRVRAGRGQLVGADRIENDTLDNFMPACAPCNLSKATYTLEQWRDVLSGYVGALDRNAPTYRMAKKHGLIVETHIKVEFYFEKLAREAA